MSNEFIPDKLMKEMMELAEEIAKGSESYIPHLTILFNNMNENRYYSNAKRDLWDYIKLLSKEQWTADDFDRIQILWKKLRKGNVIPDSIEYANNIPWKSGEVVTLSQVRARDILDEDASN